MTKTSSYSMKLRATIPEADAKNRIYRINKCRPKDRTLPWQGGAKGRPKEAWSIGWRLQTVQGAKHKTSLWRPGVRDRERDLRGLPLSLREVVAGAVLARQIESKQEEEFGQLEGVEELPQKKKGVEEQQDTGEQRNDLLWEKVGAHTIDTLSLLTMDSATMLLNLPVTQEAYSQLTDLLQIISGTTLVEDNDSWFINGRSKGFNSADAYKILLGQHNTEPIYRWISKSHCQPKLKVFCWLLVKDRLEEYSKKETYEPKIL